MSKFFEKTKGPLFIAILLTAVLIAGCSGGYKLDKDDSITTDWGTVLQYKIDSSWDSDPYETDSSAHAYYNDDNLDGINISVANMDSSLYKYSSTGTYADWLDAMESYYTQSASDRASWYKKNLSGSSGYNSAMADPESYPDLIDYSMDEEKPLTADGVEFRTYKMSYTSSYSDSAYAKLKDENSDAKQKEKHTVYFAVVKDGSHDIEISASSEGLLRDFMNTLEISSR